MRWLAKLEQEPDEKPPLGIILCTGKRQEQIELLELGGNDIHVAEYFTVLPPKKMLEERLQEMVLQARKRIENKSEQ
ncbi:hypothetical protein [Endozoicomonas sp. 8E]|uniref:hypothetical protein n=1 Tax=Endozoicomonas sp. 8E TaxID=3035692 RepID=UPI0029391183|nr:hypothetical protein [Endozoicomonas sp. 8E]WOG27181.1 hypothetical protein P6910_21935 [Endozoicomonas sp. 8E]